MVTMNASKFEQVVATALQQVNGNKRWTNAINRAAEMIERNPYMHWTGNTLLMLSDSGEIYEANGVCQCKAFIEGQPCKHRAAYKLMKRYNETTH